MIFSVLFLSSCEFDEYLHEKKLAEHTIQLLSPENNAEITETSILLTWEEFYTAESYSIEVSDDSLFTKIIFEEEGLTNNFIEVSSLPEGYTYWRVKAKNSQTEAKNWSEARFFYKTISAPSLIYPESNHVTTQSDLTFQWSDVAGSNSYDIFISKNPDFSTGTTMLDITETTFYIEGLESEKYFWKVRSKRETENWSETREFKVISVPNKVAPINGNVYFLLAFPDFEWEAVNSAESYILQVSSDFTFQTIDIYNEEISTTKVDIEERLTAGNYYFWRVKAKSGNTETEFSTKSAFYISL